MWHTRTPSAVHYANRLLAHQSHYADRPTTVSSLSSLGVVIQVIVKLKVSVDLYSASSQTHLPLMRYRFP